MPLSLANNVSSLNAPHSVNRSNSSLAQSLERLSAGLKITRTADGPTAFASSEQQRTQVIGARTAIEHASRAASLIQTGEGALNEINRLLLKIRGLALDSADRGAQESEIRAANQAEVREALETINRVAQQTQVGARRLFDGSAGRQGRASDPDVKVLAVRGEVAEGDYAVKITTAAERGVVTAGQKQESELAQDETLTINGTQIALRAGFTQEQVIASINAVSAQTGVTADQGGADGATRLLTANFGSAATVSVKSSRAAGSDSTGFGISLQEDYGVDVAGSISDGPVVIGKGDVLTATSGNAKGVSVKVTGINSVEDYKTVGGDEDSAQGRVTIADQSLVFQLGADAARTISVSIDQITTDTLGLNAGGGQLTSLAEIDVSSSTDAASALGVIDQAISDITALRGRLSAFQTKALESSADSLRASLENTVAAGAAIRNTDFALELAEFTRSQVLSQAGASVLPGSTQTAQLVLSLLR
jgi:flagellin